MNGVIIVFSVDSMVGDMGHFLSLGGPAWYETYFSGTFGPQASDEDYPQKCSPKWSGDYLNYRLLSFFIIRSSVEYISPVVARKNITNVNMALSFDFKIPREKSVFMSIGLFHNSSSACQNTLSP